MIQSASAVDIEVFSPEGDLVALVEIPAWEAERLVSLPGVMGHVFVARSAKDGRVVVRAVRIRRPRKV